MREEENNGKQCRVIKNKNYTIMSNVHLRAKYLSLKAKGLMSLCLSLPEDWDYSIAGLVTLSHDGREAVTNALNELKKYYFLTIDKQRTKKGGFSAFYTFYENPEENPSYLKDNIPKPALQEDFTRDGFPDTGFPMQISRCSSTDSGKDEQINTNNQVLKLNTKKPKEEKITFGEFSNVFLTESEIEKLKTLYVTENKFNEAIQILSNYKESSGRKYKRDYAVLTRSNWVYEKIFPNQIQQPTGDGGKYSRCYG